MTTISETVLESLRSSGRGEYASYATPVIDALVQREAGIVENLVSFATQQGLSADRARQACSAAGLSVPPQAVPVPSTSMESGPEYPSGGPAPMTETPQAQPTSEDPALARIEAVLNGMAAQVAGLTQFARDNGYTG